MLDDVDSFLKRNLAVCRRPVGFAVEFRIVRLILLEHIVNGGQEHPGNGDDCFLVPPPLLQREVTAADFWKLLGPDGAQSALNEQGLDIGPGPADPGCLFLPGTLIVLWRKPSPGAEMLRGGEHRHIHANFRDDADSGKG